MNRTNFLRLLAAVFVGALFASASWANDEEYYEEEQYQEEPYEEDYEEPQEEPQYEEEQNNYQEPADPSMASQIKEAKTQCQQWAAESGLEGSEKNDFVDDCVFGQTGY